MVMKKPATGSSVVGMTSPGKVNDLAFDFLAFCTASTCCATTDSTSSSMRLNSSKQPHAPLCARPLKILAQSVYRISEEQLVTTT